MTKPIDTAFLRQLTAWRHELHSQPELSGEERSTAARVAAILQGFGADQLLQGVGGHGVVACFHGREEGPSVLFRAELDALPIDETGDLPYGSQRPGVAHKCGHDGHMAILLGLAGALGQRRPDRGKVYLLFQPAEEDGSGAMAVLHDPAFQSIRPDFVFALHNLPGYPEGSVVVRRGAFTPEVRSLIVRLRGKTAHAAEPEHGINPALAIADILRRTSDMVQADLGDPGFTLITPVHVRMGEMAYGISAGYGEVHLTMRCWTSEIMEIAAAEVLAAVRGIARTHRLEAETAWTNTFFANFNDGKAVDLIDRAARLASLSRVVREVPLKWGEDFGAFTQRFAGAMFGLGAGESTAALHHPDYDFPDAVIAPGMRVFMGLCELLVYDGPAPETG